MEYNLLLSNSISFTAYAELGLRILVSCLCGGLIGLERSRRLKEAGLRTHMIVCCASALMIVVSKYGFADLENSTGYILGTHGADPARIAAQVISGVSFIGAGVIFHNKDNSVKGLTTAAGLWATAGIGLTIGAGMYLLGIFTTAIITITQTILHKYAIGMDNIPTVKIGFIANNNENTRNIINEFLMSQQAEIIKSDISINDKGELEYRLTVHMISQITIEELNSFFDSNDDIKNVSCTSIS